MKFPWAEIDDSYLPTVHQKTGERPYQDDLLLYKWFGIKMPRWVLARPQGFPPKMVFGNQNYSNTAEPSKEDWHTCLLDWPSCGQKPIPRPGTYQFSWVYPKILGKIISGPYFAFTTKKIFGHTWHGRIGFARWSEAGDERYYQMFPLAIRRDIR